MCNVIVRLYFDYFSKVWDVFGETRSKRQQKLQNRTATITLNVSNDVEYTIALRALGWEALENCSTFKLKIIIKVKL